MKEEGKNSAKQFKFLAHQTLLLLKWLPQGFKPKAVATLNFTTVRTLSQTFKNIRKTREQESRCTLISMQI